MSVASDLSSSVELLSSPALSAASYDVVQVSDDSDDEIVWSPAASSASISFSQCDPDEDFIVLGGPALRRQPLAGAATEVSTPVLSTVSLPVVAPQEPAALTPQDVLAQSFSESEIPTVGNFPSAESDDTPPRSPSPGLSWTTDSDADSTSGSTSAVSDVKVTSKSEVSNKKGSRKSRAKAASRSNSTPSPSADAPLSAAPAKAPSAKKSKKKKNRSGPKKATVVPVVAPTSSASKGPVSTADQPSMYQEAASFISSFLSNPKAKESKVCRLTLLQSLIIELGINTASGLPTSLRTAKAILKSNAFVNIREYLAVRQDGPEALKSIMHPSKSALIRSLKRNRNASPVSWVKGQGLQVLLVGWMH